MIFRLWILVLLALSSAAHADSLSFPMPRPPREAKVMQLHGQEFYSGMVYLESGADTALLKPHGFLHFEFEGRSVNSIRYHALWAKAAVNDSIPAWVSGVEYDVDSTYRNVPVPLDLELPSSPEPLPDPDETPTPHPSEGNN